jgi:hypothetical protein
VSKQAPHAATGRWYKQHAVCCPADLLNDNFNKKAQLRLNFHAKVLIFINTVQFFHFSDRNPMMGSIIIISSKFCVVESNNIVIILYIYI